ncbi:LuxR C-terminal-related transcriptional regulator [Desulfobacter vibrioformis]|uniref:LuxR C-terminal-related transcriptional regulator n=1 Tax=Desulfobacter vibrioformis TaxID=34031 RepID=UPI000558CE1C|nr:LuxR C-terminal-related transcriptional regulator [Desulfobacter vibrioformis]
MSKAVEKAIRELVLDRRGNPSFASAPDYSKADGLRSFWEQMESTGNLITIVWDYVKNDFLYLSDKFFNYFGFDPENVYREKLAYPLNRLIPVDAMIMINGSAFVWEYVSGLPVDQRKNYKVIAEYRMRNDHNKMIRVHYQNITLELTDRGDVWLSMMLFELSPDQNMETLGNISCIDVVSGEAILTVEQVKKKLLKKILSEQEIDVLKRISKREDTGQIVAGLGISQETADHYLKKIFSKLNASDINDATALIKDSCLDSDPARNRIVQKKTPASLPERIVDLMNRTIHYWVESTGRTKADLAEESKIWSVYSDHNGWRRTQTLDKYLDIHTLPQKPRISQVLQTAYYVLNTCRTPSPRRDQLEAAIKCVREKQGHCSHHNP